MTMILGITGGIGSGKSSVSRLLAAYCLAPLIDVDRCCRNLLEKGQPGWQALHAAFGTTYELPDGTVNRSAFREALFADLALRRQVDALLHPAALARMQQELALVQDAPLVLVEIPLLYEAGWQAHVNAVLVVYARRAVQFCRILRRDRVSHRQARQALSAQMPLAEKAALADHVIDNSGNWAATRQAVVRLGENLLGKEKVLDRAWQSQ